ncbi:Uma2 family endonuclease [Pyxidicoccus sp. 3LFB2]
MGPETRRPATYADLEALPEHFIGQIIDGELIAMPRHPARQTVSYSVLLGELVAAFDLGRRGGPGGWWILGRPELHFGQDVLVPDIVGWRRERMPQVPDLPYFTLAPDWVCEVLFPANATLGRTRKREIYAREGVTHVWLADPDSRTLETFRLHDGQWVERGSWSGGARVRAEPFEAVELELEAVWPTGWRLP